MQTFFNSKYQEIADLFRLTKSPKYSAPSANLTLRTRRFTSRRGKGNSLPPLRFLHRRCIVGIEFKVGHLNIKRQINFHIRLSASKAFWNGKGILLRRVLHGCGGCGIFLQLPTNRGAVVATVAEHQVLQSNPAAAEF